MSITPIYLDYPATTPLDPLVLETLNLLESEIFGNPSNLHHEFGKKAYLKLQESRQTIAEMLKVDLSEIFFTSGATESNNIVLQGFSSKGFGGLDIITSKAEHKSVLEVCSSRSKAHDCSTTLLPTDSQGRVLWEVQKNITKNHATLVSLLMVNNESGVVSDLAPICKEVKEQGGWIHTDATQSVGRIPLDFSTLPVDFASFSSHKFYGPKGVGILFVRKSAQAELRAISWGGGQEHGFRPGTQNVPSIGGMAHAFRIAVSQYSSEDERLKKLNRKLRSELSKLVTGVSFLSPAETSVPGILNLGFEGVEAETLLSRLPELALGLGSACQSEKQEPSHVVASYGVPPERQFSFFRIGLGRGTTEEDINSLISAIVREVEFLRNL